MIVLVAATGIRASEMLGLRWSDIMWERSEIKIKQTFVHREIQRGAKTKLSKSSIDAPSPRATQHARPLTRMASSRTSSKPKALSWTNWG